MADKKKLKLAILDMYNNLPNEGMRCIKAIAQSFSDEVDWKVFDVRFKEEIPDKNYDIFISSGGPGSPYDGEGKAWENKFFNLIDDVWAHNESDYRQKKYFFGICHSFQLLSRHFELGNVCKRKSTAFGVFPIHKTEASKHDKYFKHLPDPYYVVDSRDWQMIEPDLQKLTQLKSSILAVEKKREHVPLPRAVMAMNIGDYMYMTQFHPEADAEGMLRLFAQPAKRQTILESHGEWKLDDMIRNLTDQDKLPLTHQEVLPRFLRSSINALKLD
jgi:homoserine O-succinyltransferase/O-acetyltransferase